MFDIGFWELTIIFVVALLVLGPERLPAVARTAGRWMDKARRTVAAFRADVERELATEDLRKSTDVTSELKDLKEELEESVSDPRSTDKRPAP